MISYVKHDKLRKTVYMRVVILHLVKEVGSLKEYVGRSLKNGEYSLVIRLKTQEMFNQNG